MDNEIIDACNKCHENVHKLDGVWRIVNSVEYVKTTDTGQIKMIDAYSGETYDLYHKVCYEEWF